MIVDHLTPPYYAVIFTTVRTEVEEGYSETAKEMEVLAAQQKGFLGIEHARSNLGITISYWDSLDAIALWKQDIAHTVAREKGREKWYQQYQLRICKVERSYGFTKE